MSEFKELELLKKRMRQGSIRDFLSKKPKTMDEKPIESVVKAPITNQVDEALATPLNELNRLEEKTLDVPDANHKFLVDFTQLVNLQNTTIPPYPRTYKDKWDGGHVRMPCSSENMYPIDDEKGGKTIRNRWILIESTLSKPILTPDDLQAAITCYNSRYSDKWNFLGLHNFFGELNSIERKLIFDQVLPKMAKLALDLPNICTQPPPLLKQGQNCTLTLSQKQIACLLANGFFCTFPRRNSQRRHSEYFNYPDINFIHLFNSSKRNPWKCQTEKLKCIFHYFLRVTKTEPVGCVTFHRQSLDEFPDWSKSTKKLTKLHVSPHGSIEDNGSGMLQVDFANEFIGGGVLGRGCVQEEIRFVICPELIVSRLFTQVLGDNECVIVTGCERFSRYKGYADAFMWDGDFIDKTPKDRWQRRLNEIVAVDATYFKQSKDQFLEKWLRRETNKAYCGFFDSSSIPSKLAAVATGNWGCGIYRGDPHLKFLLQLIAAAECDRDVAYFTFNNSKLCCEISQMYKLLISKDVTVGNLWNLLLLYQELIKCKSSEKQLYHFLCEMVQAPPNHNS